MKGLAFFGTLADGTTERACYYLCVETCPAASEWSHPAGATHGLLGVWGVFPGRPRGSLRLCLGLVYFCPFGVKGMK